MTAITFPNSPSSGDTHTAGNGIVYTYDGEKWTSIGTNSAGTWTRSGTTVSLTTAGDDLNVDSGTLFVDASANSVGIGTTTPSSYNASADNLVVQNDGGTGAAGITIRAGTGAQSTIYFADGTGTSDAVRGYVQYFHNGDFLRFGTDANERFRITSDGKLGVGVSDPSVLLHLAATDPQFYIQDSNSTGNNVNATLQFRDSSNTQLSYFGYASASDSHLSLFNTMSGGNLRFGTESNERLTITSDGKCGVGTSLPANQFEVVSSGTTKANFTHASSNKTSLYLESDDTSARVGSTYYGSGGSFKPLAFFTSGYERMEISATGLVGIGTSEPTQILELKKGEPRLCINATAATADLGIEFEANGTRQGHIFQNNTSGEFDIACGENTGGSHFMTFKTGNGSEKMRLDSSGRLNIGTSVGAAGRPVHIHVAGSGSSYFHSTNGGTGDAYNEGVVMGMGSATDAYIWNYANGMIQFATNGAARMTIDSSGRLLLNGGSDVRMELGTNGTTGTNDRNHFRADGDNLKYNTCDNGNHIFEVNGTERLRLDANGNLGAGISNPSDYHASAHRLVVDGGMTLANATMSAIFFADSDSGTGEYVGQINYDHGSDYMQFVVNNGERMRIDNSGQCNWYRSTSSAGSSIIYAESDVVSTKRVQWYVLADGDNENRTGVYTTISSDERMKKDIVDASSQWDDIKNIRMRKFRYKANGDESPLQLGVVAQELEAVCPNLVTRKPATAEMSAESEGLIAEGEDILSWKQSIVHLKALKALQEAMARIETLEAEVAALKSA